MSVSAMIKFAPLVTVELIRDPDSIKAGRTLYQRGSLKFLPAESSVPVLVNHDDDREVGVVHELFEFPDTDGLWLAARCTITNPPGWLKRGTGASFSYLPLQRHEVAGWHRVTRGIVREVSVLSPSVQPAEPRASVCVVSEPRTSPAAGRPSARPVAGEVIYGDGTLVRRYFPNAVLAVGGTPVRGSAGNPRRVGRDYVLDRPDGSQLIYHGADAYAEALRDGTVGVR